MIDWARVKEKRCAYCDTALTQDRDFYECQNCYRTQIYESGFALLTDEAIADLNKISAENETRRKPNPDYKDIIHK